MGLNNAQARAVRSTFTHVSELLDDVLMLAREDPSPFDRRRPDLTQAESRRLQSVASALRQRMLEALGVLEVSPPERDGSARWSARTSFLFAEISLSELTGHGLRGYGAISDEDEQVVSAVAQDLRHLVSRAMDLLGGIDPAVVEDAVARIDGRGGRILRRIWDFARRHEMVEVWLDIQAVAERAAAPAVDVGVFGRTNAGKSSLINALVGQNVLPVGAVPVTAAPLRLARGPASLRVIREGGLSEELALEDLARFTLARAGAADDVLAMDAFVPTAPDGVRLIDTPGVGSYANPVGARAFEWLPRCDLGLLLVPAGSSVGSEEVALGRGLVAAGVEVRLVLSKADLLAPGDLDAWSAHLHDTLRDLGLEGAEAVPVSTLDGDGGLGALLRDVLNPVARNGKEAARARVRRRIAHLVTLLEAAWSGRAEGSVEQSAERRRKVEAARRRIDEVLTRLGAAGDEAVAEGARVLARCWRARDDGEGALRAALDTPAEHALRDVREVLDGTASGLGAGSSVRLPMPPLFSFDRTLDPVVRRPALLAIPLGKLVAARRLGRLAPELDGAYLRYARRLERWSSAALAVFADEAPASGPGASTGELADIRAELVALGGIESEGVA